MTDMESFQIGPYSFTKPIVLDDAKPPTEGGVYGFLVRSANGGKPALRYVGKSGNLRERINYGHDRINDLFKLAGRDPNRLYVAWHLESSEFMRKFMEAALVGRYGDQLINVCMNTEHWRMSHPQ